MALPREIGLMLDDLGEVFGGRLSPRATELYIGALGDLDRDALAAGVGRLIREHECYFPTPAEIRAATIAQAAELYPVLPPPAHDPFPNDNPRTLDQLAAARRALSPRWAEVRRALAGAEDPAPRATGTRLRPIAEVLAGFVPVPMSVFASDPVAAGEG